jgi:hypothetical protein
MEITGSKANIGHFELSNTGTCDIEATVQIKHITDDSGTTEKDIHTIDVPAGAHRSFTFSIAVNAADKKTFVVVTVQCKETKSPEKPKCEFVPKLTIGEKDQTATKDEPIDVLPPKTATPPGTTVGGTGKGSACSTPANEFVTIYTFYNTLDGDVQVTFTVVNECLCEAFIAQVTGATVTGAPGSPGKPIGTKDEKPQTPLKVPAKNDTTKESGSRPESVLVKKDQAITITAGCSGSNNKTKCKGAIKDIEIHVK